MDWISWLRFVYVKKGICTDEQLKVYRNIGYINQEQYKELYFERHGEYPPEENKEN